MRPLFARLAAATLALLAPAAQCAPQDRGSEDRAEAVRSKVSAAAVLRGRFQNLKSPGNYTWATAKLASIVCPADPVTASGMFLDAIRALNGLPGSAFTESNSILAASSFPALARLVLSGARGCDPSVLVQVSNDTVGARIEEARRNANAQVGAAAAIADSEPDRAAQLLAGAVAAADPEQFDFETLVLALSRLRSRAPDLADELFDSALESATEPVAPNPAVLQELGRYLFVAKDMVNYPDEEAKFDSADVDGSTILKLDTERHSASPDLIADYILYVGRTLKETEAPAREPRVAYALAYELLAEVRELQPEQADDFEQLTAKLSVLTGGLASAIQLQLKESSGTVSLAGMDADYRNALLLGTAFSQWRARRFDAARDAVSRISDQAARQQLGDLMAYGEAAAALERKDPEYALRLSHSLPRGMKHAMLYIGMAASAVEPVQRVEYLQLALKEMEPFFPEQQSFLLPAIAARMWEMDRERTYATLNQLVASMNAASLRPRRQKFDPTAARKLFDSEMKGASDGPLIIKGRRSLSEVVEAGKGRRSFPLDLPGARTFDLVHLLPVLKDSDTARVEAIILGLRGESQRVQALVSLAGTMVDSPKR